MQTECSADLFGFARVEGRAVVAAFDGGMVTSDAGALLLGSTDRALRLVSRFAGCFRDDRSADTGLLQQWPAGGPKLAWRATGLGAGFSSVSIGGNRLCTMGDRGSDQFGRASWAC